MTASYRVSPKALEGIRVLDFTWVRAGPWSTRWLGAMGAEIIKVEWPANERGLRSWGLGYDVLREIKPDIIYVSHSGMGHTGRQGEYTMMGPTAQAFSGMTHLSGLPDKPPAGWGWSILDDLGGTNIVNDVLSALHRRNRTGLGQHVDLSQMLNGVSLLGPALLDATVNGRGSKRAGFPPGNRAHWPGWAHQPGH